MSEASEQSTNHEDVNLILNQSRVEQEMSANAQDGLTAALEFLHQRHLATAVIAVLAIQFEHILTNRL